MAGIFVSYRRSDSQGEAGRLFDDLVKHFGEHMVFMDVAAIEAGRDFRKAIEQSVASCGVLLVVIGPEWLNAKDESGARRLDDPTDFVRVETASALRRDIPVIPVLVHGARMPDAEQLPDDLRDLAYRNCTELTHARWRSDVQLLVEALRRLAGETSQIGARTGPKQVMASPQAGIPQQSGTSKLDEKGATRIDPATVQRVSRELALHIGPIAEIVVKRAVAHCNSVEDLYLKAAEEIDSLDEREEFLLRRASIPSTPRPDAAAATILPSKTSGALGPTPFANENAERSTTAPPAAGTRPSSRWKYLLLISGGVVFLILVVAVAMRFAPLRRTRSFQKGPTLPQETRNAEPAPIKSDAPAPVTGSSGVGSAVAAVPKVAAPQRVRLSQDVSAGLLIKKILPLYPPTARQARVQGTVVLQAAISNAGTVESLHGISGHPMLIPAAIDAVKRWRYKPYVVNGKPVAVETEITVNFTLKTQ